MTPTDLGALHPHGAIRAWVSSADSNVEIFNHSITVDLDWWNSSLSYRGLPGGPITGMSATGTLVDSGQSVITRGHVFTCATSAADDPESALRLLWHALAWGSGPRYRLNHRRMDSIAADPARASEALSVAARLSRLIPIEAYRRLYPDDQTLIGSLGPAFFTKYLYFAGGGNADHPCLILDSRVAASLVRAGWTSLNPGGASPATTYGRYVDLLARWRHELTDEKGHTPRGDLIERWLFDNHPADVPDEE